MFTPDDLSRREFIKRCSLGTAALAAGSILGCQTGQPRAFSQAGAARYSFSLDQNWLFGGKYDPAAIEPTFPDQHFSQVTLPHCVTKLSWQNWDAAAWQDLWIYRRHFDLPRESRGRRVFVQFAGVMVGTTPTINGHPLPQHLGGYLPSRYEITDWVKEAGNVLAVVVDSRWSNVPPEGAEVGAKRVDYLEPGGIYRSVNLNIVPPIFIDDVFAKPVGVLDRDGRIEVACSLDCAAGVSRPVTIRAELLDKGRVVSRCERPLRIKKGGKTEAAMTLARPAGLKLWDTDEPNLYDVVATLVVDGEAVHDYRTRIGLREARFETDGFFLNGKRLRLFGLNRHELYPYVGYAMPSRVMRRDAEILRREFNCNAVRCSHYPQSEAFLDACDELGLLVWEEVPGWGYLGDEPWKELLVRDTHDMIVRDRNHPSIVIWGVRVNESDNDVELYRRTTAVAQSLDDSRPTSGSMTGGSIKTWKEKWKQDVFAYDDYETDRAGGVGIRDPLPGVPYMLAEAVGQFNYTQGKGFNQTYRRAGDIAIQRNQALWHAEAHSKAAGKPRICGVIAWCGFDYGSLINSYQGVKCPGVADIFRIPKLGASFYQAQGDPKIRPVIAINFHWDFGAQTPKGPGRQAAIFSNCDRLELFIDGRNHATLHPDSKRYPHLRHPPFFADLEFDGAGKPELRIDGYIGEALSISKSYSSDPAEDRFYLNADDVELIGDGADATRIEFRVGDKFGQPHLFAGGEVAFKLSGPGCIVGDNPFGLEASGGVGAVWVRTLPDSSGQIGVEATHSSLGSRTVKIQVQPDSRARTL
jgi:beta-galactosidase